MFSLFHFFFRFFRRPIIHQHAGFAILVAIMAVVIPDMAHGACVQCTGTAGNPPTFSCSTVYGNASLSCTANGGSCTATGSCTYSADPHCFLADTMISTLDGDRPIQSFSPGDDILCSDPQGNVVKGVVLQVIKDHADSYLLINDSIRVTGSHRFFARPGRSPGAMVVASQSLGDWTQAGELVVGDEMRGLDGDWIAIRSVEAISFAVRVYNFEVAPWHNYFADGVLVHNKKPNYSG